MMFSLKKLNKTTILKVKAEETHIKTCQKSFIKLVLGFIIVSSAISLLVTRFSLTQYVFTTFFKLSPNSILKRIWVYPPVPLAFDVYFFNWTNPEELLNPDIKLVFKEVGPYRFNQFIEKINITWHQNNTVTFKQRKTMFYDDLKFNNDLSVQITTLNFVTAIMADFFKDWSAFSKRSISYLIKTMSPGFHLTKTAKDLLSNGVEDFFIDFYKTFPFIYSYIPRYEKAAIMAIRNNSEDFDGILNTGTGVDGNFNIKRWNYNNQSELFPKPCGNVEGTLGELFGFNVSKSSVKLFIPEICRYITLDYAEDVTVAGINGYKYIIGNSTLDNGTIVQENKCFCDRECIPSGMLSLSSCRYGLPIYLSLAHFYNADSVYLRDIEGLKPEKSKHESYMVIDPITGIPLAVSIAVQLNILLQPTEDVEFYDSVRTIYFPTFWLHASVQIPNVWALLIKIYMCLPWILLGTSILLTIIGFNILVNTRQQSKLRICRTCYSQHNTDMTRNRNIVEEAPLVNKKYYH